MHAKIWCSLKLGATRNNAEKTGNFRENLRNFCKFRDFFAFITLQILTGHEEKLEGIFLSVHRNNLVKETKKIMGWKCVSIALDFPLEFRVFFAFIILKIRTGHKKK